MIIRIKKSQSGITLVLSLLIIAAVTAVAVAISVLIINEVIGTRGITYSVKSFYASETAIEKGLWLLRDYRRRGETIEDTIDALNGDGSGALQDARVTWQRQATNISEDVSVNIRKDESVFFDLYDTDGIHKPRSVNISTPDCGPTNIQLAWTGWAPGTGYYDRTWKNFPAPCNGSVDIPLEYNPSEDPERFRLQIRAFDGAATDLTLVVKDELDQILDIASTIQMTAVGVFPDGSVLSASQAIQASVPWILPISDIYSYVIYSEEDLTKNN